MVSEDQPAIEATLSDDQKAVAQYLDSPTYQQRESTDDQRSAEVWTSRTLVEGGEPLTPLVSFWRGLFGLVGLVMATGIMMPILIEAFESSFNGRPNYLVMTVMVQTFVIPPIVSFSLATVTPMFWYGSVILRFLAGIVCVIPGMLAFYVTLIAVQNGADQDFWFAFTAVMFTQFLTAATVAVTVQMWSPWTLSHARADDTPLPPMGLRALMELTVIAAIGFSIFVGMEKGEIIEGLLFFMAVGLLTSITVISVQVAFLRKDHQSVRAAAISAAFAFATAALFCGFFAVAEFGWNSLRYNFLLVAISSVYGAALICGVMWLGLKWLRLCGWRCISREEEKEDRQRRLAESA